MNSLTLKSYPYIWLLLLFGFLFFVAAIPKGSWLTIHLLACVVVFVALGAMAIYSVRLIRQLQKIHLETAAWGELELESEVQGSETLLEQEVAERTFELEIALRELQEANATLEQMNREDSLTGLFNRRHFDKQLTLEFRKAWRQEKSFGLFMLDIDHFKKINDQYGHLIGDQVLVEVAHRLHQVLQRPTDSIFRYGGEEFVMIVSPCTQEESELLAVKLCQSMSGTAFQTDAGALPITVSLGVCYAKQGDYALPEHALKAADDALYQAKKMGRNRFVFASEVSDNSTEEIHLKAQTGPTA